MKEICVLISSYEGVDSAFRDYDEYQDPRRYVSKYNFNLKYIKKETAIEQLDKIYNENYDLYINFMWGQKEDNVAGIEALKYIESKNVPIIGTNSKFLSLSKIDFKHAAQKNKIRIPKYYVFNNDENYSLNFPVIIKPSNGCGSLYMTEKSVCYNQNELSHQIKILLNQVKCPILVEEFIAGKEFSVMVIENKDGVMAMPPIVYEFSKHIPPMKQFLHFEHKFDAIERKEITYKIYNEDIELVNKIKEIGCQAYNSLEVIGSGYARIDMRVDNNNNIYVLEVNPTPALFYQLNNNFGDDYVISKCFKGGHEGLMEHMIFTKCEQIKECVEIRNNYNKLSEKYDEHFNKSNFPFLLENIVKKYNFEGTVLDLGCGTGAFGNIILKYGQNVDLTGIDISPKMAEKAIKYKTIHTGLIQNIIMDIGPFNHIISSGALHFLDNVCFEKTLHRMFQIATNSITLGIEDIPDIYNKNLASIGYASMYSHNNTKIVENFEIPYNWKLVHQEKNFMWSSPATGDNVYGTIFRFENKCSNELTSLTME